MGVPLLDEILTFLQSVVSWFVQSAPPWLKIIIGLFLVVMAGNILTPVLLGTGFACTSTNTIYKINSPISAFSIMGYRMDNEEPLRNSSINYSTVVTKNESEKSFLDWLITYGKCYSIIQSTNWTECSLGQVSFDAYLHPDNFTQVAISEYDGMVESYGTVYVPTQEIVVPKCSNLNPRIYLFGSVDVFDIRLWLIFTLVGIIIPLAIKWYEINHVF